MSLHGSAVFGRSPICYRFHDLCITQGATRDIVAIIENFRGKVLAGKFLGAIFLKRTSRSVSRLQDHLLLQMALKKSKYFANVSTLFLVFLAAYCLVWILKYTFLKLRRGKKFGLSKSAIDYNFTWWKALICIFCKRDVICRHVKSDLRGRADQPFSDRNPMLKSLLWNVN